MIEELRKKIPSEEFDYQALLDSMRAYERPRDKVTVLLRRGIITRVKKGIYVFGQTYARRAFSREILANMIYGPSYVSLDYALHYHGFIPERVEALTSCSYGRSRRFNTPVGLFIYRMIPSNAYWAGIDHIKLDNGAFLIASPEKALCDKIYVDRGSEIRSHKEMKSYLTINLRIDAHVLRALTPDVIDSIAESYRSRKMRLLSRIVHDLQGEGGKA